MRLNNKIMHGIGWTSIATFGTQGLRLIFKLILAKLLLPEHYGIIGMAILLDRIIRFVSYQYQIKRLIGITMVDLVRQVSGTLCTCVLMGLIIYRLDHYFHTSHVEEIVIATGVIIVLYSLYLYLFERKIVNKVLEITKIREKLLLPLFSTVW